MSQLQVVGPRLWRFESQIKLPGGVPFPVAMSVVQLADGSVLLHAPLKIDDALAAEIEAIGPVAHLVAPNLLHHLFVGHAQQRWPQARTHAVAGLDQKRPDLRIDEVLGQELHASLRDDLDGFVMNAAPTFRETPFFHRPSGTLLATDLIFHVKKADALSTQLVMRLTGTYGKLAMSRAWRFATKDKPGAAAAAERILAWEIQKLAPVHGTVVDDDAKNRLAATLAWMRGARARAA